MLEAFVVAFKRDHTQVDQTKIRPTQTKVRRFTPHISALTLAEGADQAGVLFVIPKPLTSFILSVDEARSVAARLTKAADEIDYESLQ